MHHSLAQIEAPPSRQCYHRPHSPWPARRIAALPGNRPSSPSTSCPSPVIGDSSTLGVPHLRDGFIVAKVGNRAKARSALVRATFLNWISSRSANLFAYWRANKATARQKEKSWSGPSLSSPSSRCPARSQTSRTSWTRRTATASPT